MADQLKFSKRDIVLFSKFYVPSRHSHYRTYVPISINPRSGMLIGKTICYEGKIHSGFGDEPTYFVPEKSVTFWLVELYNGTNRYRKPWLVKEEDLIYADSQ